jgi:hypothetical protein
VVLGSERFRCTEPLFNRYQSGENMVLQDMIKESIEACPTQYQEQLWSNIVLSGGNTLFRGFAQRLQKELEQLHPPCLPVVHARDDRRELPWLGATRFAHSDVAKQQLAACTIHAEHMDRHLHRSRELLVEDPDQQTAEVEHRIQQLFGG